MESLYHSHHNWLCGWLHRKLGNRSDAADIAHDTFLRVWAGWRAQDAAVLREPRAYLATVAKRLLVNRAERQSLERAYLASLHLVPEATARSAEERAVLLETLHELDTLLDELPAKARAAFLMSQLEGMGYAQIAARLQVSERTVGRYVQSAEELSRRFDGLPPALGMAVLGRNRLARRRAVLKSLAVAMGLPAAGWLAYRSAPASWTAQYRTATGERRRVMLADGSLVEMNTASAMEVKFDAALRHVLHFAGEILVQTAADPADGDRPFVVSTPEGRMRALGTRFIVRRDGERTRVAVLEGAVEVRPARLEAAVVVRAGGQMEFGASGMGAVAPLAARADAWVQGVIFADDMPLEAFAAELSRYRPGLLRCTPEVAGLRVSGAFQIDDTDEVLALLAATLPVRIETRTRYWTTIAAR